MEVTIYTTNCPQCMMLETAMKRKGIPYNVVYGEEEIISHGFSSAPILKVGNSFMVYKDALRWVNAYERGDELAG